jgi:hypothetical protein
VKVDAELIRMFAFLLGLLVVGEFLVWLFLI